MAVAVEMATPAPTAEMAVSAPPEAVESMGLLDMAGLRVDGSIADAWKCSGLARGRRYCERANGEQRGTYDRSGFTHDFSLSKVTSIPPFFPGLFQALSVQV